MEIECEIFLFFISCFALRVVSKINPRANGRNIVGPFIVGPFILTRLHTLLHVVACCWDLSLKLVKLSAACK